MYKIIAVIATLVAGILGTGILGNLLNWPDAGAVLAVATMGGFILYAIENKEQDNKDKSDNKD